MSDAPPPLEVALAGRDAHGRFAPGNPMRFQPGNPGGPGNPNVRFLARVQAEIREAVQPGDVTEVLGELKRQALEDKNTLAAKAYLDRVAPTRESADAERLLTIDEHGNPVGNASGLQPPRSNVRLLAELFAFRRLADEVGARDLGPPREQLLGWAAMLGTALGDVAEELAATTEGSSLANSVRTVHGSHGGHAQVAVEFGLATPAETRGTTDTP